MKCPYCGDNFTPTESGMRSCKNNLDLKDINNEAKMVICTYYVCPNEQCKRPIIYLEIKSFFDILFNQKTIYKRMILPDTPIKSYPSYIPEQIRNDYEEACKISQLSPKASATLARRCLQGIIRDFHGINKGTLAAEIKELEKKIDPNLWDAIDAVRSIGNIGAHMEKDVNLIINIDPQESEQLIRLIELLFDEWYITRHKRAEQLDAIKKLGAEKQALRHGDASND